MKLLEKLNKYNQYLSFNIFAFNGYTILLTKLYILYYYQICMQEYGQGSWVAAIGWLNAFFCCFIMTIFAIAVVVYIFEQIIEYKIRNSFFINNNVIKMIRYIGIIISLIYITKLVFSIAYILFFMQAS